MATLASESWTGSNGSAWPAQWTTGQTGTGSAATIQSNRGRLASGTQGGYSGASRISRRLNITAPTNVDVSGTWTPDANEPYGAVAVRADNTIDTGDGYYLLLNKSGTLELAAIVGYSSTTLGTFSFTASSGTTYGFRLRAVGSLIQARVWSGTEPSSWNVSVTNTAVTGSGAVGFTVVCGSATVAHAIDFDDLLVTDGADSAAATVSATATLTPAATVSGSSVTIASESWTGADGAAWPAQWVTGQTGTGAAATIQTNRGRLASGAQGAYSGASRISRRLNVAAAADVEISGIWRPDANEPYGAVAVRADTAIDSGTGYYLLLNKSGTLLLERWVGFSSTTIGSISFAAASSTSYGFRLRAVGTSIKARVWSGTEPSTWQVDVTDTGVTAAGAIGLTVVGGNAATAHAIDFDDLLVTNGQTGPSGSVAAAGTVTAGAVTSRAAAVAMTSTAAVSASAGTKYFGDTSIPSAASIVASATAIPRMFTALRVFVQWVPDVWHEVTREIYGPATIRQGRPTEFDDVGPGVLSFALRNIDGEFMPENPDSPHFPYVREDRPVYVLAERGPQSWVRFRGYIKSIEPDFPTASAHQSIVRITAVDALGLCAARRVQSSWALGASYWARTAGTRYDSIVLGGDGPAQSYFDNVTTSPGEKARAVVSPWSDFSGPLSSGTAEGLSVEGSVTFAPSSLGSGAVVKVTTPNPIRCLQFWLKVPAEQQVSATNDVADVLQFNASEGTPLAIMRLKLNGTTQTDLNMYALPAATFLGTVAFGVTSNRWVRVTFLTKTSAPTTTDVYYDGGGMVGGGFLGSIPLDLRAVTILWFGGAGSDVAGMEVAGISMAGNEGAAIPAENGLIAASAGDVANRLASWSHIVPGGIRASVGAATTDATRTGSWHGRTSLDIGQEIARSARGVIWVHPSDWQPRLFARDVCYPGTELVVLDSEGDLRGAPSLRRAVDSRPTRITTEFPGGRATVIDDQAELASQISGTADSQVRTATVSTIVADRDTAEAIGAELLVRGGLGMRITQATIDLEQSATDLVPKLFDATTPASGLFPTQRLRLMVPHSHFGEDYKDVYVQGWQEIYDATGGASIVLDLSPAYPPPGPQSTTASMSATASIRATVTGGTGGGGGGAGTTGARALAQFGTPLSGKSWHSGSWTSTMAADRATRWGTWRGAPNDFATVYPAYATWAEMQGSTWVTDLLAGFAGKLNYGLPLLPTNRPGQWADVTSGANDAVFLAIANDLASKGWASKTNVRVGIEVNGNWFANGITWSTIPQFKAAFIRVVNLFRSVSTAFKFSIDWSAGFPVSGTPGGTTPAQVFDAINPGDSYWDSLGIDTYDHDDLKVTNEATYQNHLRPASGNAGIGNALDWVRSKTGKGLIVPEWGCATYSTGGGDNPYYITRMHEFFTGASDVLVYECYFNEPYTNVLNSMWTEFGDPRQCPNAGTEYRRLWATTTTGGGGTGGGTGGGVSTTYPPKTVSVYKMMWSVNGPNIGSISTGVNCVRIAFAQGDPPSLVGWGAQGQSSFLSEMAVMRARGVRFILSVGGSGGALNPSNRAGFLSGVANIRSQMGGVLDGLDWDIEAAAMNTSDTLYLSQQLKAAYGAGFAITFVPNGGNVSQYLPAAVACQSAGVLDEYGQQFYDAVVSVGAAAGRIQEAINAGIPVSKISVGMMIASDAQHWTNAQCYSNMQSLMSQFPGLQRAYLWEASRSGTAQWVTDMRALIGT